MLAAFEIPHREIRRGKRAIEPRSSRSEIGSRILCRHGAGKNLRKNMRRCGDGGDFVECGAQGRHRSTDTQDVPQSLEGAGDAFAGGFFRDAQCGGHATVG